jgi:hypothetical protein
MKKLILSCVIFVCGMANAQVQVPKASPLAKVQQRVGLSEITINYSRPSVNNRVIFGGLIPFGEKWRLGANENTKFQTSDDLDFETGILKAGTYALFATPNADYWILEFYSDTTNWGMPEKWDEQKVALRLKAAIEKPRMTIENLTIGIEKMEFNSAELVISWEEMNIRFPFTLNTKEKVLTSIKNTMTSKTITADDYHKSASYYFTEQIDMKKALEWSTKAVEMKGVSAYWMTRLKSQLQAANGDYKGAIETAKISMEAADKDGDQNYVKMNQSSIEEWSKKK